MLIFYEDTLHLETSLVCKRIKEDCVHMVFAKFLCLYQNVHNIVRKHSIKDLGQYVNPQLKQLNVCSGFIIVNPFSDGAHWPVICLIRGRGL